MGVRPLPESPLHGALVFAIALAQAIGVWFAQADLHWALRLVASLFGLAFGVVLAGIWIAVGAWMLRRLGGAMLAAGRFLGGTPSAPR